MRLAETARAMAAERSTAALAKFRAERARQVEEAQLKMQDCLATIVRYTTDLVQSLNPDAHCLTAAEWIEARNGILVEGRNGIMKEAREAIPNASA
jgi:hypothetical protein